MTLASNRFAGTLEDITVSDDATVGDDLTVTDDLTVSGKATVAEDIGAGTLVPNLGGNGRAVTVSSGTTGALNPGRVEIQGSKTTDATFGVLDYYHQANRVARISSARSGADNSGTLSVNVASAGVLAEAIAISKLAGVTFPGNVHTATVAGAATADLTVSGLLGNTETIMDVLIFLKNSAASDKDIYLRPNAVTSNLVSVYEYNSGAAFTAGTDTQIFLGTLRLSATLTIVGRIKADATSGRRFFFFTSYSDTTGTDDRSVRTEGVWQESSTELTSLNVHTSAAQLDIGSFITVYRALGV
jgi:hypothetical protein